MIDFTFLKKLSRGDITKMKRYISLYLTVAPEIFERMHKNVEQENWPDLFLNAHSIKPQTDYMGIESLKSVLIEIEESIKNKNFRSLKDLYNKAYKIHEESQVLLNKKLNEL